MEPVIALIFALAFFVGCFFLSRFLLHDIWFPQEDLTEAIKELRADIETRKFAQDHSYDPEYEEYKEFQAKICKDLKKQGINSRR